MMDLFLSFCGLLGNVLFAVAAWPTAIRSIRKGGEVGTPLSLGWTIWTACASFYTYILGTKGFDWIVASNAVLETSAWTIILFYHYFPRKPLARIGQEQRSQSVATPHPSPIRNKPAILLCPHLDCPDPTHNTPNCPERWERLRAGDATSVPSRHDHDPATCLKCLGIDVL